MMTLSPKIKHPEIAKIADMVEEELRVEFLYSKERGFRILDKARKMKITLERVPSGFREIATLVYVIKYSLEPGHLLMVEEPEAHLHPNAQSILIRALSRLIPYGIRVVMTTHSIHVLDEVNSLVKLSRLSPSEREKLNYLSDEGLKPENVAIYMVNVFGEVTSVKISEKGIDETDMDRVLDELANRYAKVEGLLRRKLRNAST